VLTEILVFQGARTVISNNRFDGPLDAILWEVPPSRPRLIGPILAVDCVLSGWTFALAGFAGPPDCIENVRGSIPP